MYCAVNYYLCIYVFKHYNTIDSASGFNTRITMYKFYKINKMFTLKLVILL